MLAGGLILQKEREMYRNMQISLLRRPHGEEKDIKTFKMDELRMIFNILMIGLALSFIVFLLEIIVFNYY